MNNINSQRANFHKIKPKRSWINKYKIYQKQWVLSISFVAETRL